MATPQAVEQIACSFCPKGRLLLAEAARKKKSAEKNAPSVDNIECDTCAKGRRIKLQQQAARLAALARGEAPPADTIDGELRKGPMTPAQMRDDHKKQAARAAAVIRGDYPPDPFDDGGPARNTGPLPYNLRMHLTYLAEVQPEVRADPDRDLVAEWDSPEQVLLRKAECARSSESAEACALKQSKERDALKYQQAVRRSISDKERNPPVFKHSQAERDTTAATSASPSAPRSADMINCSVCNKQKKRKDMIHYAPVKSVANVEGGLMLISMCDMACLTRANEDKLITIKK